MIRSVLIENFPGTGDYAAIKVHKVFSVGCGALVRYHFSSACVDDDRHLQIDESWHGYSCWPIWPRPDRHVAGL